MRDPDQAVKLMRNLRAMGVRLTIDDFGTGYSSLGYLKLFPINNLKVDRSFVRDLPHSKDDVAITRAVIAMAHSLEMNVIAEASSCASSSMCCARRAATNSRAICAGRRSRRKTSSASSGTAARAGR